MKLKIFQNNSLIEFLQGHKIKNSSGTLTQRESLIFTGDVTVTDDSSNDQTIVNITGGSTDYYGVCSTSASTAAKTVTVDSSFVLETGARVTVKFSNANTATTPTLNVNSTNAKSIYSGNTQISSNYKGLISGTVDFVYDGTYWQYEGNISQGHTILNGSGSAMNQRSKLQFVGATVTDDGTNDKTIVTTTPQSMIGDAWVNNHNYAVGDYCIDGNTLYKCKTAHTSSASYRPPYASYWDAVSVASQLGGDILSYSEFLPINYNTSRLTNVTGGYKVVGNHVYIDFFGKLAINIPAPSTTLDYDATGTANTWDFSTTTSPITALRPRNKTYVQLQGEMYEKISNDRYASRYFIYPVMYIDNSGNGVIGINFRRAFDISYNWYMRIHGDYFTD